MTFLRPVSVGDDVAVCATYRLRAWFFAVHASAMIVQGMESGATGEDIACTFHALPTHSEAIEKRQWRPFGRALHTWQQENRNGDQTDRAL